MNNNRGLSRCGIFAFCIATAACSQTTQLIPAQYAPSTTLFSNARNLQVRYRVLYRFRGEPDGEGPNANLIDVNGLLYGTTFQGGVRDVGTVFSITTAGKEKVLHSFYRRSSDGDEPFAGLTEVKGTLYGTTYGGGAHNDGTVFSTTRAGRERVLYSFAGGVSDGAAPRASLMDVNGTLYGTTRYGGLHNEGTVFSITTSGTEKMLYSFAGGVLDGAGPYASLIDVKSNLYGTTAGGGAYGEGTVFSITAAGKEKLLYSFGRPSDGIYPYASLIYADGALYGTTLEGGAVDDGTVFSITISGTEKVLHSFDGADGAFPSANLIDENGTLYGSTVKGGAANDGTVFSITTAGTERILHSFGSHARDGALPYLGFTDVNGTLYGATSSGGNAYYGTVFCIKP